MEFSKKDKIKYCEEICAKFRPMYNKNNLCMLVAPHNCTQAPLIPALHIAHHMFSSKMSECRLDDKASALLLCQHRPIPP